MKSIWSNKNRQNEKQIMMKNVKMKRENMKKIGPNEKR